MDRVAGTPEAASPRANATAVTKIAAEASMSPASAGTWRATRPARTVSSRPASSSARVVCATRLMPSSGRRKAARKPNSSAMTPPRLSMPSTRPLIATSALPEVTAAA